MNMEFEPLGLYHVPKILVPVLKKWQQLNNEPGWNEENEVPWWYNERALVSLFAGAVWRCKGTWAFEEFTTSKWASLKQKFSPSVGRCDIAFGVNKQKFWAEAKRCWLYQNEDESKVLEVVNLQLEDARNNVRASYKDARAANKDGYHRLAMVFISLRTPATDTTKSDMNDFIKNRVNQLKKIKGISLALAFPPKYRMHQPDGGIYARYLYPGIILAFHLMR